MTRARDVANLVNGTAIFTGTVTVPTPVNGTDAANKDYVDSAAGGDIKVIDNIAFDGIESRWLPKYQGDQIAITNPLRLEVAINGTIQSIDYPETVWLSMLPRPGLQVDSDGYLNFSEVPPAGSSFNGKILLGPTTNKSVTTYPFAAADIMLGV